MLGNDEEVDRVCGLSGIVSRILLDWRGEDDPSVEIPQSVDRSWAEGGVNEKGGTLIDWVDDDWGSTACCSGTPDNLGRLSGCPTVVRRRLLPDGGPCIDLEGLEIPQRLAQKATKSGVQTPSESLIGIPPGINLPLT